METSETQSAEQMKKCPKCGESIQTVAMVCRHCQADLRNWFARHSILTVFLVLMIIGIIANDEDDSIKTSTKSNSSAVIETVGNVKQEEENVPEPALIELTGTSQQASKQFTLEKGLSIFKMTHTGNSNFIVSLLDSEGNRVESLANEIGKFDGSKAIGIDEKGSYILDIAADGKWTIKIEQPRPISADSKPRNFTGVGQQTSPFVQINKGLTTFKLTHSGNSNFIVTLLDKKGNRVESLVNEIGKFDGSKAVRIDESGIYLLDVSADGNWTISIE